MQMALLGCVLIVTLVAGPLFSQNTIDALARERMDDLRLSVYITAHSINRYLTDPDGRREGLSLMHCNGITKAYLEVYRSGLLVDPTLILDVRNFLENNNVDVVGGIATVPGEGFGVRQEGRLGWFNWQHEKTQNDLLAVVKTYAPLFDEFIIDDFLCTADTSEISKAAKGSRNWSLYRRDLMVDLSRRLFIEPAKAANPDMTLIIKFPQWYDRFQLFGYDPARQAKLFDKIWIGTESRGQYTQRYGFVQPFESFVNYRWLASIGGEKTGGAWFDHGDCDEFDFIEQAYQSVLAGAPELVIFNYNALLKGHPGHHQLRKNFRFLADLAKAIEKTPVQGVAAYKPPNSDAGGDLYLFDFIGMLGIPLIPVSEFPTEKATIFFATQAAADTAIVKKIKSHIESGGKVVATTGFLAAVQSPELNEIAGINISTLSPMQAHRILIDGDYYTLQLPLGLAANINATAANILLKAQIGQELVPFLTGNRNSTFYVLNSRTFSQRDFDVVGEVLLCPRPLGLLEMPQVWADTIRSIFNSNFSWSISAPTRVCVQPFGRNIMIHNYNNQKVNVRLNAGGKAFSVIAGQLSQSALHKETQELSMEPRTRIWIEMRK